MKKFKPIINPNPLDYEEDSCPSFAEVNKGHYAGDVVTTLALLHRGVMVTPIDWYKALENPEEFDGGWYYLYKMAKDWCTCACGNLCVVIPREGNGAPVDIELRILGGEFMRQVRDHDAIKAKKVLDKIEDRSLYLIREIYKDLRAKQAGEEGTHA